MIYGYCRVSTKSQLENNSLEQQEQEILKRYPNAEIRKEQFTATKMDRPVFSELIEKLEDGDRLICTKLDRFARTSLEGMKLMQELLERGVVVEVLNFGQIEGGFSSNNKLMFQIMLAFAEYERDMIVERTQAGKEVAKTKAGFKEGRPKRFTVAQLDHAIKLLAEHSYREVEQMTKISQSTLAREVRRRKLQEV